MKKLVILLVTLFAVSTLTACDNSDGGVFIIEDAGPDNDVSDTSDTEDAEDTDWLDPDDYLADDPLSNDNYAGPLDEFARCVTDSGAYLYGANWDFRVEQQRLLFNRSVDIIKYVDCLGGTDDVILEVCFQEEIEHTPTWVMGDGELILGLQTLEYIAELTDCEFPEDTGKEYETMAKTRLAQQLTENGTVLYGVIDCYYCSIQKGIFDEGISELNYHSCNSEELPDELDQECTDLELIGFPTWIFGDDSQFLGVINLTNLANTIDYDLWPNWAG